MIKFDDTKFQESSNWQLVKDVKHRSGRKIRMRQRGESSVETNNRFCILSEQVIDDTSYLKSSKSSKKVSIVLFDFAIKCSFRNYIYSGEEGVL